MIKYLISSILILGFHFIGISQNIGIGTNSPNQNAILEIVDTSKGILIPRMDSIHRKNIPSTSGLMVYDLSTKSFWYNNGVIWQNLISTDNNVQNYHESLTNFKVYQTPGIFQWTAPNGIRKIVVECWGAGAGLLQLNTNLNIGGSSGAYGKSVISVTPDSTYAIRIGYGGQTYNSNGFPITNNNAYNGGLSSFDNFIISEGGVAFINPGEANSNGQFSISGTKTEYNGTGSVQPASAPMGGGPGIAPGGGGATGNGAVGRVFISW